MRFAAAAALLALAAASLPPPAAAAASAGSRRLADWVPQWPWTPPALGSVATRSLAEWAPQWPWTPPAPGSEDLRGEWERTLALLWARSKDSVGFCVGSSQCVRRRCSRGLAAGLQAQR